MVCHFLKTLESASAVSQFAALAQRPYTYSKIARFCKTDAELCEEARAAVNRIGSNKLLFDHMRTALQTATHENDDHEDVVRACDAMRFLRCTGDVLRDVLRVVAGAQAFAHTAYEGARAFHMSIRRLQPHEADVFAQVLAEDASAVHALPDSMAAELPRGATQLYGKLLAHMYLARPGQNRYRTAIAILRLLSNGMHEGAVILIAAAPKVIGWMQKKVAVTRRWPRKFIRHLERFAQIYDRSCSGRQDDDTDDDDDDDGLGDIDKKHERIIALAKRCSKACDWSDYLYEFEICDPDDENDDLAFETHADQDCGLINHIQFSDDQDLMYCTPLVDPAERPLVVAQFRNLEQRVMRELPHARRALNLVPVAYAQLVAALLPTGVPCMIVLSILESVAPEISAHLSQQQRLDVEKRVRHLYNFRAAAPWRVAQN